MARLTITLLGPFGLQLDGESVIGFESDKVRALFAYLVLEPDRPIPRQCLANLLWPERAERIARHDLSQALYSLRSTIADQARDPPFITATRQTVQLNPLSDHWLDVAAFLTLIEDCKRHIHRRLDLCKLCIERLHQAVDLYKGELLEGFSLADNLPFEEWLLFQRERFHQLAVKGIRNLVICHERRGEHGQALRYARRYVALEPYREEAHRQVMRALAATGRRSAALLQYDACHRLLETELDVEPEEETNKLHRCIHDGETSLPSAALSRHNLPAPISPFVGRATELTWIKERLRWPTCRLLTLIGPGGIGKTRLALEACSDLVLSDVELADHALLFPDGIYLVRLAHLRSSEAIIPAVASAIGFSFFPEDILAHPGATARDPKHQLFDYLRGRRILLILDSFEHLLEGARLITQMLHAGPGVKILVTSRVKLGVQGECFYPVSPLRVPDASGTAPPELDGIRRCSAVELFLTSARRVNPGFKAVGDELWQVTQICRLVQGMPLAILLAATRIETLSARQIAAQIVDRSFDFLHAEWPDVPERQRSMRAVLDWSWNLLDQRQQEILAKLAVFCCGFSGEAARQVIGASEQELVSLVQRSLLKRTSASPSAETTFGTPDIPGESFGMGSRYEMHELLRKYAMEKLGEMPSAVKAAREAHADYYAGALRRWARDLKSERQQQALTEMGTEIENVGIAWEWAAQHVQAERLGSMAEGLGLFYKWCVRYQEGEAAFEIAAKALAQLDSQSPHGLLVRARLMTWQGAFRKLLGYIEQGRDLLQQSIALLECPELSSYDTTSARAFALMHLGHTFADSDREKAASCYRQSLDLYRTTKDLWGTANAMSALATIVGQIGDLNEAHRLVEDSLTLRRAVGAPRGIADSLVWVGWSVALRGEIERGRALLQEGIGIYRRLGDLSNSARGLVHFGLLQIWAGKFAEAETSMGRAVSIWQELGGHDYLISAQVFLGIAQMLRGKYDEALCIAERCLMQAKRAGLGRETALAHFVSSGTWLAREAFARARDIAGKSVDIFYEIGQQDETAWALAVRAYAALGLKNQNQAEQSLCAALSIATGCHTPAALTFTLPAVALLKASDGELKQAIELYTLALCFPFVEKSRWVEDIVGRRIALLAATLPAAVVDAAQERGRQRDPWSTAEELLATLGG